MSVFRAEEFFISLPADSDPEPETFTEIPASELEPIVETIVTLPPVLPPPPTILAPPQVLPPPQVVLPPPQVVLPDPDPAVLPAELAPVLEEVFTLPAAAPVTGGGTMPTTTLDFPELYADYQRALRRELTPAYQALVFTLMNAAADAGLVQMHPTENRWVPTGTRHEGWRVDYNPGGLESPVDTPVAIAVTDERPPMLDTPVIVDIDGRGRVVDTLPDLDFALNNGGIVRGDETGGVADVAGGSSLLPLLFGAGLLLALAAGRRRG